MASITKRADSSYLCKIKSNHRVDYWKTLAWMIQSYLQVENPEKYSPKYRNKWRDCNNPRLGKTCHMKNNMLNTGPKAHKLILFLGCRLFNALPRLLRDVTNCSVEVFKTQLDKYHSWWTSQLVWQCIEEQSRIPLSIWTIFNLLAEVPLSPMSID